MIGAPRALYTPPLMGTQSNASSLVDTVNGRVLSSDRMLSIVPHKHCYIVQVTLPAQGKILAMSKISLKNKVNDHTCTACWITSLSKVTYPS